MGLSQLVEPMYELTGYQKSNLNYILSKFPECIRMALKKDKVIQINGLGTFTVKVQKARKGRNPTTGETIDVPAKTIVHFKIHKSLKELFLETK